MSRFRMLRFAAMSWLPLFSLVASSQVHAQTFNAATNWLATYPTTASVGAATTATWGAGSAWSAGELSYNWTNQAAAKGNSSLQSVPTFYLPSTGYLTSGTNGATQIATYTYTVPFQAYQFNPGATIHQQVGETLTQQIASGQKPIDGSAAITLPANTTVFGSAANGTLQQIAAVKDFASATSTIGFSTTSFNPSGGTFNDGQGSVQDSGPGVWYNYSSNATSSSLGALNAPSGAGDTYGTGVNAQTANVLTLGGTWGPSYVAWTAPASGSVTINSTIWDVGQKPSDGNPSFFVFDTAAGASAPILSASRWTVGAGAANGTLYTGGTFLAAPSSTIAGSTLTDVANLSGYTGSGYYSGLNWASGQFTVSAGETIYFAIDPNHDYGLGSGLGARPEGNQDPISLQAIVSFTAPEPSSFVLLGMAGVGLALAAWKRRRLA
jgi:PEP-CTERM motif